MRALFVALLLIFSMASNAGPLRDVNEAEKRGDFKAALEILKPLVNSGNPDALGGIGDMYASGKGVDKDLAVAYSYWLRAAEKHLGKAMYKIGVLYTNGEGGLPKDSSQAALWYKKAAEHGYEQAMMNLSSIYWTGQGLEENRKFAVAWARIASLISKTEQTKKIYLDQLLLIAKGMSDEELDESQKIILELAKLIDANKEEYRKQQVPTSAYD